MQTKASIILLLLLFTSCNNQQELPILSYYINEQGKRTEYDISKFHFTDHFGNKFNDQSIKDKVVLMNFFFTRCPTICPKMIIPLKDIAEDFRNNDEFLISSISIDYVNDTTPVLHSYAENHNALMSSNWYFLHSTEKELQHISELLRTSFKIENNTEDFYHSTYAALIDKKQRIRGFYNLLDDESIITLKSDIDLLLE